MARTEEAASDTLCVERRNLLHDSGGQARTAELGAALTDSAKRRFGAGTRAERAYLPRLERSMAATWAQLKGRAMRGRSKTTAAAVDAHASKSE